MRLTALVFHNFRCFGVLIFYKGKMTNLFVWIYQWHCTGTEMCLILHVLVFRSEQLLQLQINNKRRFASYPADSAFTTSTWSLSLSVKFSLAARDLMTSMESFIWISFAKTWPITKRKQKKKWLSYFKEKTIACPMLLLHTKLIVLRTTSRNSKNSV